MSDPRIRLLATDLDGTLLRSNGSVSERTIAALARTEAAGLVVVFVTARPVRWVRELAGIVHDHGIVICANGAVTYDAHADRILQSTTLPPDAGQEIVAAIRSRIPNASFAREALTGFGREAAYPERHPTPPGSPIGPIGSLLGDDTVKLLVRDESVRHDVLRAAVLDALGPSAEATASDASGLVEISAAGVTKAAALARLCEERGIAAGEVVAVGDMLNDLPMLGWAGTAVAVANAHPDVLAAADRIVPSNDEDGVAVLLEELS